MNTRHVLATVVALVGLASGAEEVEPFDAQLARWSTVTAKENEADTSTGPFMPPATADEWYTVTIAEVPVGYMNTGVATAEEGVHTMEIMDVQVSRGADTSRMAFHTDFFETSLDAASPSTVDEVVGRRGGVTTMAYDQRFANSEVKMSAAFTEDAVKLTSFNGEKEHISDLELPDQTWLGRMRARLEFTRQCRQGVREIVVQTMRPELGPRVVNLSSTFVGLGSVWDGTADVEASLWSVQISDVPVNMSEAYPVSGPLRCYRMLQMGLAMPFGHLRASLSSKEVRTCLRNTCRRDEPEIGPRPGRD